MAVSQSCIQQDLQFVNDGRGCKRRPYGRGILQSRSYDCLIYSHVAIGCAVLFILRSILLLYSGGSVVNRVQVVLSGFSVRWFCYVQGKKLYVCMVVCIYCLHCRDCVCRCDGDVICVCHYLNRCSGWWYVCSVNVE